VLWLPDVFGYAWNLPQLIKQAGLEYFFTIKIGWNQYNRMPYDSFWWQGLDGTTVLTHFSTTPEAPEKPAPLDMMNTATYNANLSAFTALGSWQKLKQKESQRTLLMSYGYGDGGGGPTREMNENALVLHEFPGLPRLTQGRVIDFFRRLEAESGPRLPTWNGELYLELHRGTYTSQARNKRANRKSEFLLHDAEFACAWAALLDPGYAYPAGDLRRAWQLVCLNQFHDIIPGSSIAAVYAESLAQYARVQTLGQAARDAALAVLQAHSGGDVLLANPSGFARRDPALWSGSLPEGMRFDGDVIVQAVEGGTLIDAGGMAPCSLLPLLIVPGEPPQPNPDLYPLHAAPDFLENSFVRVELNAAGDITRIYHKPTRREVLPAGALANQLQAFEDRPLAWDAWDVDIFYEDKLFLAEPAESMRVVESGPLRATLEVRRRILHSTLTQRISLAHNSPQITFDTLVDWREQHIFLKAAFPVEVLSPLATYEIQWGSVQRPTHRSTSWDWARFETCAQKWVDLSEGGYGVALLNDCKYGHDIHGNVMRLSLLRGPTNPDPTADQGGQRFTYALLPHGNAPGAGVDAYEIARLAYALNDPLIAFSGSAPALDASGSAAPLVELPHGVILETVKRAEDGRGVILRFYECNRQRGPITLRVGFPVREAWMANLLEEDQEALEVVGQEVRLSIRPFQIVTLRLVGE
jgi:alpha-mannosidase